MIITKIKKETPNQRIKKDFFSKINNILLYPNVDDIIIDSDWELEKYFIINRILMQLSSNLQIMHYINIYLNSNYLNYKLVDFIKTINTILKISNFRNTNNFAYIKRYTSDYKKFYKKFDESLYDLYNAGIINDIDLSFMTDDSNDKIKVTKEVKIIKSNKNEVNKKLIEIKDSKKYCHSCININSPLIGSSTSECVDISIIYDKPLIDNNDFEYLDKLTDIIKNNNLTYACYSMIQCSLDLYDANVKKSCNDIFIMMHNYYNKHNKLNILIGPNVKKHFKIKGSMANCNGKLVDKKNFILETPFEPALNSRKKKVFENGLIEIENILKPLIPPPKISEVDSFIPQIPKNKIITKPNTDLLLVDIKSITIKNNESPVDLLLHIFEHKLSQEKYFMVKPYVHNVYIKYGNLSDNKFFSDQKMDQVSHLTEKEKSIISNLLRKKTNELLTNPL